MTSPLELRSLLRSEIADGKREVVRLTDEQLYLLNTLRGMRRAAVVGEPGPARRCWRSPRRGSSRPRGSRPCSSASTRRLARAARGRDPRRRGADRAPARSARSTSSPRTSGARPARCRRSRIRSPPSGSRETLPDGARRRDREARAALPRDRGRRGPGLRCAAGWRRSRGCSTGERGRPLRLPRPGAGDLPCRPDRGAGPDRIPARLQLPQRPADPRPDRAARPGRARLAWPAARDGRAVELITAEVDAETIEALRVVLHRLVDDRGRRARLDRGPERARPRAFGRLEAAPLRQPGPVERRGRRRRAVARAGRRGRPGAAARTSSCASRSAGSRASSGRSSCCSRCRATTRTGWIGCCTSGRHGRRSTWSSSRRWPCCGG